MATINQQTVKNRDNARIAGIQKHCMTQASILVGGVAYTPAQAIQIYQNDLDAAAAVAQARSAYKAALAKAKATEATTVTFDSAFKHCIEGAYAGEPATLDDFGVTVKGYTAPSVTTKAAAVAKAAATRALHSATGTNPGLTIPATPSSTAQPAPVTTPATPAIAGK